MFGPELLRRRATAGGRPGQSNHLHHPDLRRALRHTVAYSGWGAKIAFKKEIKSRKKEKNGEKGEIMKKMEKREKREKRGKRGKGKKGER